MSDLQNHDHGAGHTHTPGDDRILSQVVVVSPLDEAVPDRDAAVRDAAARAEEIARSLVQSYPKLHLEEEIGPPGLAHVRLLRCVSGRNIQFLVDPASGIHPSYRIVQMTHGRVLPINFPRAPRAGDLGPVREMLNTEQPGSTMSVLVIDTELASPSLLDDPPLAARVVGTRKVASTSGAMATWRLHGTFVAGIVGMVAPCAEVRAVGLADRDGDGLVSDFELGTQLYRQTIDAEAIGWPAPPDAVNLSLGAVTSGGEPMALKEAVAAVANAGFRMFAAAGNDGQDGLAYPAAFGGVRSVGALVKRANGAIDRANWSNGQDGSPDYWAPGTNVVSTTLKQARVDFESPAHQFASLRGQPVDLDRGSDKNVDLNEWALWDGSSMATAFVTAEYVSLRCKGDTDEQALLALGTRFRDPHVSTSQATPGPSYDSPLWRALGGSNNQGAAQTAQVAQSS